MPLAFQSLSHGEIAFGFFNIETDMILLDRYFFFAADFCAPVMALAGSGTGPIDSSLTAYIFKNTDIGNLGGAIHGVEFTGLSVTYTGYSHFPGNLAPSNRTLKDTGRGPL